MRDRQIEHSIKLAGQTAMRIRLASVAQAELQDQIERSAEAVEKSRQLLSRLDPPKFDGENLADGSSPNGAALVGATAKPVLTDVSLDVHSSVARPNGS
jgi:hypothetical protein